MHTFQLAGRVEEKWEAVKVLTVLQNTGKPGCARCMLVGDGWVGDGDLVLEEGVKSRSNWLASIGGQKEEKERKRGQKRKIKRDKQDKWGRAERVYKANESPEGSLVKLMAHVRKPVSRDGVGRDLGKHGGCSCCYEEFQQTHEIASCQIKQRYSRT